MSEFLDKRAVAARWMYERPEKDRESIFWRWWVLTAEGNPGDSSNPKLPLSTADLVFASLVEEGLLVPTIVTENGMLLGAHRINPAKDKEWKAVMHPPHPLVSFLTQHAMSIILTLVGTVGGFLLGKVF